MSPTPKIISDIHPKRIAPRLAALRHALGMSRAQFADSVEINRSSYTLVEDGRKVLNHRMAYAIAVRHGVSMDYLYRGLTSDRDLPESCSRGIRSRLLEIMG
jgi:DNA-binding XRE family transcriptional regulator